ncbi:MAG TPA: TetR/AcrR family transcriptional regulator [Bacteroidales bacterium]|nr:TetR/AcrR family transcriptional regulator [Bacteroidales bacterium]
MVSERQQQIIGASVGLIDKKGIQGFTIKNLSREIGISESGIYRHFDSKIMILSTILDTFKQKMDGYYKSLENDKDNPAEVQIIEFFNMIFGIFSANPSLVSVIFAEEIFQNEPTLSAKVLEIQMTNEVLIKKMLKGLSLNSKQSNYNSDIFTTILFGSVRLLVRKWKLSSYSFNLMQKGEKLIDTVLNLLR